MNKKMLVLVLFLSLALIFTGCTQNDTPTDEGTAGDQNKGDLIDGTYLIKGPVSEQENYPMAILEVKDGEIESLDYNEYLVDSGEAKNSENYAYEEGLNVIEDLNTQYNEKKDINEVDFDAVSGATYTKGNFKDIVERLVEKAKNGETYTPVYKDGSYEAKAEEPSNGWLPQVTVVVKHGQITGVDYKELAVEASDGVKEGDIKTSDNYDYEVPFEIVKEIQKLIIDNNGTENLDVDGITGATNTRTTMLELVEEALSKAK